MDGKIMATHKRSALMVFLWFTQSQRSVRRHWRQRLLWSSSKAGPYSAGPQPELQQRARQAGNGFMKAVLGPLSCDWYFYAIVGIFLQQGHELLNLSHLKINFAICIKYVLLLFIVFAEASHAQNTMTRSCSGSLVCWSRGVSKDGKYVVYAVTTRMQRKTNQLPNICDPLAANRVLWVMLTACCKTTAYRRTEIYDKQ